MRPAPRARVEAHELAEVSLTVNGSEVTVRVPTRMHLADVLREHLGLTGTHLGCEHGVCGMCTVLVDGAAARACLLFAVQCEGATVVTVEGLGTPGDQHPLQRAFSAHHGLQCGFCTPGMLLSSYDLLANGTAGTAVSPDELPVEMSGVLCRCTGYRGILAAVADVAAAFPAGVPEPSNCAARTLLGRGGRALVTPEQAGAAGSPGAGRSTGSVGAAGSAGAGAADVRTTGSAGAAWSAGAGRSAGSTGAGWSVGEVRLPGGAPSATVEVRSQLSAPVDAVWRVLDDFDQLARCLPGASLVETLEGDRYRGRAVVALGPVKLSFDGLAQVVERDADEHRLRVLAQGADSGGSATHADIRLGAAPSPEGGTALSADATLYLSGRIALFGRALAGDVSRRMFEQFASAVDVAARTGLAPDVTAGPGPVRILLSVVLARCRRFFLRRRLR